MEKLGTYYISRETDYGKTFLRIRQQVTLPNGKRRFPRLGASIYGHVPKNRESLQRFVDKLNYGLDLKKQRQLEIETAFIPKQVMESFKAQLQNEIPSEKDFRYLHSKVLQGRYTKGHPLGKFSVLARRLSSWS